MNAYIKEIMDFDSDKTEELIKRRKAIVDDAQTIEARALLCDLIDESVKSSGLRKEIKKDFTGSSVHSKEAEGILYVLLLVSDGYFTKEIFTKILEEVNNDCEEIKK